MWIRRTLLIAMAACWTMVAIAQFSAKVIDAQTGEPVSFATAQYIDSLSVNAVADVEGRFSVPILDGISRLMVRCVGYKPQTVTVNYTLLHQQATIKLFSESLMVGEVVVKSRRERYRRKDNPAVELMRRVIATNQQLRMDQNESYNMQRYSKHVVAFNEVSPKTFKSGFLRHFDFLKEHAEPCPETGKLILPIIVNEKIENDNYDGNSRRHILSTVAEKSDGFNTLFAVSDFITSYIKDIFTDVDISRDKTCRLLQHQFISPLSATEAIAFYHYFIVDTIEIGGINCINIAFTPSNVQDFGFSGNLYVTAEAKPIIKRAVLNIPSLSGVNFVENLIVTQDFSLLPSGQNMLTTDNMVVELRYTDNLVKFHASRLTINQMVDSTSQQIISSNDIEWDDIRPIPLSQTEATIGHLLTETHKLSGYDLAMIVFKALVENSIETTPTPNKFDIIPVNTILSSNYVDGMRIRLGGQTTANLNSKLFWRGYAAYGMKDQKWKYKSELEYSFNTKKYMAHEFPRRSIVATCMYDDMSPVDQFSSTDKDNMYTSVKAAKVEHMNYVNSQALKLNYETRTHFLMSAAVEHSRTTPAGKMTYVSTSPVDIGNSRKHIDQTSFTAYLRFAPNELFGCSKQRRLPINGDATVLTLEHSFSSKGLFATDYTSNITQASIYKRFWMPAALGHFDLFIKGGVQWNKVPFPYLFIPASNLSYVIQFDNWSFCMLENMEFLNDRYISLFAHWNLDGRLLNRIPLVNRLKLREYVGFKMLCGALSDRNNPYKSSDGTLLSFPTNNGQQMTFLMGKDPYMEFSVGIANIFKILTVQYVRRLTYTDNPLLRPKKNGVRFAIDITF